MNAQADTMHVQDAQVAQLRFAGLTSTSSYSLTLFASRETPGNRITKYTVNDASLLPGAQKSILYDPTDNVNQACYLQSLAAGSNGSYRPYGPNGRRNRALPTLALSRLGKSPG